MLAVRGTVSAGLEVGTNALLFAVGRPGSWFVALKSASELAPRASACTDHRLRTVSRSHVACAERTCHHLSFESRCVGELFARAPLLGSGGAFTHGGRSLAHRATCGMQRRRRVQAHAIWRQHRRAAATVATTLPSCSDAVSEGVELRSLAPVRRQQQLDFL